jgi:hypothetical protein
MANPSRLSVAVVIACLYAAPAHGDTIYTCAGRNGGAEVLQNMPCETDSEVSVQRDMSAATSVPLAPGTVQGAARAATAADVPSNDGTAPDRQQAQNAASDASGAATDTAAAAGDDLANLPTEPAVGMTQKQVRAILGSPTAIVQEEASQGIEVTWIYGDSRVLQFDATGRLSKK